MLILELLLIAFAWRVAPAAPRAFAHATPVHVTNTEALGRILYTDYVYYFQTAGLILLVAMIGAIVLTLRTRPGVRRQIDLACRMRARPRSPWTSRTCKPGQGS